MISLFSLPQALWVTVLIQGLSVCGMLCNCFSYQLKHKQALVLCQLCGALLFFLHFLLLGAWVGCMMNLVGVFRNFLFSRRKQIRKKSRILAGVCIALILAAYVLTFTLFGTAPTWQNLLLEFLPIAAMIIATVAMAFPRAREIRRFTLLSSPLWLTYNIIYRSLGGTVGEVFNLFSVLIGIFRNDRNKKEETE